MFFFYNNFLFFLYFADRAFQYIYLNINQLDALNFIMSLFHASTCFEHSLNLWKEWPAIGVMIPETVEYNFGHLTMSTCARNM